MAKRIDGKWSRCIGKRWHGLNGKQIDEEQIGYGSNEQRRACRGQRHGRGGGGGHGDAIANGSVRTPILAGAGGSVATLLNSNY